MTTNDKQRAKIARKQLLANLLEDGYTDFEAQAIINGGALDNDMVKTDAQIHSAFSAI